MSTSKIFQINHESGEHRRVWAVAVPGFGRKVGYFLADNRNDEFSEWFDNLYLESTYHSGVPPKSIFVSYNDARKLAKRWNALPIGIRDKNQVAKPILLSISILG